MLWRLMRLAAVQYSRPAAHTSFYRTDSRFADNRLRLADVMVATTNSEKSFGFVERRSDRIAAFLYETDLLA